MSKKLQLDKKIVERSKKLGYTYLKKMYTSVSKKKITSIQSGTISFRCNICGQSCKTEAGEFTREQLFCQGCNSTARMRSVIHLLSIELFGESLILPDFPIRPHVRGIGMSDRDEYAILLASKLNYKNTYYHKEPKLDITAINPSLEDTLDFLISSDVFEHVAPPVSVAFENAYKLLKPGGVLIFTVPYKKYGKTKEHFPDLYDYKIIKKDESYVLRNTTKDGRKQVFKNLVFHGGAGVTLEMRIFSESSLKEEFTKVGFHQIRIHKEPYLEYGIYWSNDWSLPLTARK